MSEPAVIREWELAEIARSRIEAAHTPDARLVSTDENLRRYLNPPADTPFPLECAFHAIGDVRGRVVLDYGCGTGENALPLTARGARVIGLDVSDALLALARRRLALHGLAERALFLAASAHDVPLPDASVDAVMGIAILHHLDLPRAAAEVFRVLKPGGIAVFTEPVRNSRLLARLRAAIPYHDEEVSDYERPLTDEELRQFAARFTDYRTRAFSLPFINLANVLGIRGVAQRVLYRLDGALLRPSRALDAWAGLRVCSMRKPLSA